MSSGALAFDTTSSWRAVHDALGSTSRGWDRFSDCADSALNEIEAIQEEVVAKVHEVQALANRLEIKELELWQQQSDYRALLSRFDEQTAQLNEALNEIRQMRVAP